MRPCAAQPERSTTLVPVFPSIVGFKRHALCSVIDLSKRHGIRTMFRSLLPLLIAALPGVCLPAIAAAEEQLALFSTDGSRQTQYRSPTPPSIDGPQPLDTAARSDNRRVGKNCLSQC